MEITSAEQRDEEGMALVCLRGHLGGRVGMACTFVQERA